MMGSGRYWGPICDRLQGRVSLSGFDMPGHGRSDAWTPGPGLPDFHSAVTRIAAAFIQRPMDLIGHSMGATVALRIAVAAPEAIRSLTLIEPVLFAAAPGSAQEDLDRQIAASLAQGRPDKAVRSFLQVWGQQPYDSLPAATRRQMDAQIALVASSNRVLHEDSADMLRPGGLESIAAPVMLISGRDSPPVIHDIDAALAARLPDIGRATVPGAGHMLPITHPDEVAGLIAVNLDRAD